MRFICTSFMSFCLIGKDPTGMIRAHNKCEECGIANGTIVRKRSVRRPSARGRRPLEIVSEAEYKALAEIFMKEQVLLPEEQRQRMIEEERQYLADNLNDYVLRKVLAENYRDVPGVTVILDPNERFGFHSEGDYHPYGDFDDHQFFHADSAYTDSIRLLKALGLTRVNLQTNHIDGNPSNCYDSNLEALCQFCHGPKSPKPKRSKTKLIKGQ